MAHIHFTREYALYETPLPRWRYWLPILLQRITGKERYLPADLEWADKNWTHNVFRAYEWLFFRKYGVRKEWTYDQATGFKFFTLEARVAHFEGVVRAFFRRYKFVWVPVYTPQLAYAGFPARQLKPIISIPYVFAVARDDTENDQGASGSATRTVQMTCSGSDRALAGFPYNDNNSLTVSSFTYDSVSMGTVVGSSGTQSANGTIRSYVKAAPNTTAGANLSITYSGSSYLYLNAIAYTGVDQTTPADGHDESATGTSVASRSVTFSTTGTGAWIAGASRHDNGGTISGTGSFTKITSGVNGAAIHDTNGTVSVGSNTVGASSSANGGTYLAAVGIQPPQSTSVTVNASVLAATVAGGGAPSVSGAANVVASVLSAALSTPAPAVTGAANVTASLLGLTVSIPAVNVITPDMYFQPSAPLSLTVDAPDPTVTGDANVTAGVLTATVSIPTPTVNIVQNITVNASVLTITVSVQSPSKVGGLWTAQPRVEGEWTPQARIT